MLYSTLAIIAGLGNSQIIDCTNAEATPQVIATVSLDLPVDPKHLPETGTLVLAAGWGESMKLFHVPETDDDALKGLIRYQAEDPISKVDVVMAENQIRQTAADFVLSIRLQRRSDGKVVKQDLHCASNAST